MREICLSILFLSILSAASLFADARHFTYLYEAPTAEAGEFESETSITWSRTSNFAFREEIEMGVTDRFQLGIYPLNWAHRDDKIDNRGGTNFAYEGGAIELIYNLTNPNSDPIGLSLYEEINAGRRHFESESKLIAQKHFGPVILDYNATLEAEWAEEGLREHTGELQQALGASYEIFSKFSVGIELVHELVFPEWRNDRTFNNLFVGPNVSFRRGSWYVTVTALAQATNTADEPDLQVRTIFGIEF
ncbi:MAG: hypothetical protein QOI04_944 [Verrucomicrobiota bacterium]|jgi:hypothetical protein